MSLELSTYFHILLYMAATWLRLRQDALLLSIGQYAIAAANACNHPGNCP